MFIAIEGLDASGKNTIAEKVSVLLKERGISVQLVDKNGRDFCQKLDPKIQLVVNHVHEVIYNQTPQEYYNKYPKEFWVTIQASWFELLSEFAVRNQSEQVVLAIGWYYKFISKYLKKGVSREWIFGVFKNVAMPDAMIVLDVDPSISVSRRNDFSDTEVGVLDGYHGDRKESFKQYQNELLQILTELCAKTSECHFLSDFDVDISDPNEIAVAIADKIQNTLNGLEK